ncbi:hypothetical protein AMTR_s00185p00019860 [Amborella trichopoda]|uniref:Uncharacterized protein n=1 Tax=Amborella trichopoda TaxID=13333 RepID=U5D259_AMBTC|nr:hypothetical protein AMTR_s00185p00019860 [Amborella trichopoda]
MEDAKENAGAGENLELYIKYWTGVFCYMFLHFMIYIIHWFVPGLCFVARELNDLALYVFTGWFFMPKVGKPPYTPITNPYKDPPNTVTDKNVAIGNFHEKMLMRLSRLKSNGLEQQT